MNALKVNADQMYQYSFQKSIPQGQVEFSKVQFIFSKDWDCFDQKIAQFVQGDVIYNKDIIHGSCTVPSELQLGPFTVFVKGYGAGGAAIATANGVTMVVVPGGKAGGTPPVPPEPDLYARLLKSVQDGDSALQKEIDAIDIPTALSQLEQDAGHRTVTDEEKEKWNSNSGSGGGSVDPKTIQQIVDDYLTENLPADGFSPTAKVEPTDNGAMVTIVDKSGQTQVNILDGKNGDPGKNGVGVRSISGNADGSWTITYTDENTETISNEAYTVLKTLINGKQPLGDYLTTAHNTSPDAHNDIRNLISGLTSRLNALLDSDDTSLDQLSEIVAYIKSNRSLIEQVTTSKVSVSDIVNNLTTNDSNKPLSASMGVELKKLIDAINVPTALSQLTQDSEHRTVTDAEKAKWNSGTGDGGSGTPGEDGGYYSPKVTQPDAEHIQVDFTASKAGMPEVEPVSVTLPKGTGGGTASPLEKLIFTGAVSAEYDGKKPVTVDIPAGGGENQKQWRKIAEITVSAPVNKIEFTQDSSGIPFNIADLILYNTAPIKMSPDSNGAVEISINGGALTPNLSLKQKDGFLFISEWNGVRVNKAQANGFNAYWKAFGDAPRYQIGTGMENITSVSINALFGGNFVSGNIVLYGR